MLEDGDPQFGVRFFVSKHQKHSFHEQRQAKRQKHREVHVGGGSHHHLVLRRPHQRHICELVAIIGKVAIGEPPIGPVTISVAKQIESHKNMVRIDQKGGDCHEARTPFDKSAPLKPGKSGSLAKHFGRDIVVGVFAGPTLL